MSGKNAEYEKIWDEVYGHDRDPIRMNVIYPLLEVEFTKLTGKKILDLGCGNGSLIRQIQKYNYKSICGIDQSGEFLKTAKKNIDCRDTKLVQSNILEKLPFENDSFDSVFAIFVINELPLLYNMFCEINRVLAQEGCFYIVMTHPFLLLRNFLFEKFTGKKNEKFIGNLNYKNKKPMKYILSTAEVSTPFFQYTFEDIINVVNNTKMEINKLKEIDTSSDLLKEHLKYQAEKNVPKYLYLKLTKKISVDHKL
ncbi:class I SAM-dependent methyltransferase [uncultured Desulfobacter sp.]|uniref:class I SAM-dependent methyltransferase n=1 Tax=uncultured Desulfobacter sp. TaxID=240139 RepID=UPI0029C6FD69|nr:class I SAM-dependent methyltransferase [uncultured Desulfobacter sp.]